MSFTHEVVLALSTKAQSFSSTGIMPVVCLCRTKLKSVRTRRNFPRVFSCLCRNLFLSPPCLKASALAFRYALLADSPVANQGICSGAGIAKAVAFDSRPPAAPLVFCTPRRVCAGLGDGDMRTSSANELGDSLWAWPCPPRLPWCFLAPFADTTDPRDGKASLSSTAGTDGVGARDACRLVGLDCG